MRPTDASQAGCQRTHFFSTKNIRPDGHQPQFYWKKQITDTLKLLTFPPQSAKFALPPTTIWSHSFITLHIKFCKYAAWQHASACQFVQFPDRHSLVHIGSAELAFRAIRAIRVRKKNLKFSNSWHHYNQGTHAGYAGIPAYDASERCANPDFICPSIPYSL